MSDSRLDIMMRAGFDEESCEDFNELEVYQRFYCKLVK